MWTFVFSLWDNVFMAYDSEKEAKRLSFCLLSSAHFRWWNIASDWADRRVSIRLLAFNALSMFLAGTSVFGFTWAASAAAADATLRNGWKRMGIPVATLSWQPFSLSVSLYRIFQMEILVIYVLYPLLSLSVMDHSFALFFFLPSFIILSSHPVIFFSLHTCIVLRLYLCLCVLTNTAENWTPVAFQYWIFYGSAIGLRRRHKTSGLCLQTLVVPDGQYQFTPYFYMTRFFAGIEKSTHYMYYKFGIISIYLYWALAADDADEK